MKRWTALVLLAWLAGCSSGNGDDGGGGGGLPDTAAELDGTVYGVSRAAAEAQVPSAGIAVVARLMPGAGSTLATATTTSRGTFVFSEATGNTLPRAQTLLLTAESDDRRLSGIVNTTAQTNSTVLNEVTHLAALAMRLGAEATFTDAEIALYQTAAREALEAALVDVPTLDFTAASNQSAAAQLAAVIRASVEAGTVTANASPSVQNAVVAPTQLQYTGGTVEIACQASDADGDALTVEALVWLGDGAPTVVPLTLTGGEYLGRVDIPGNAGAAAVQVPIGIVADDGRSPAAPAVQRVISVLAEGRITLDILVETLFDEPASRRLSPDRLDRLRPRVLRGSGRSARQVNENQTIRGAAVVVNDDPGIAGETGSDGLLLLDVPMHHLEDDVVTVTTSIAGRVAYRQALIVPDGVTLLGGDVIEIDLVLAPQADWTDLAAQMSLPAPDFGLVPITAFFGVLQGLDAGEVAEGTSTYRAIDTTDRADDRDFFAVNLAAGDRQASGQFADPNSPTSAPSFGPTTLSLTSGEIQAVAALIPPE